MRLWHQKLIQKLPRKQLLGQHRECCALRGLGWGRKHSVINYVFKHPYYWLFLYHEAVIEEMERRNFHVNPFWKNPCFRGEKIGFVKSSDFTRFSCPESYLDQKIKGNLIPIYPEHDDKYLNSCLENLKKKGIEISS